MHNVLLKCNLAPLKSCCLLGSFLQTEAVSCLRVFYTRARRTGLIRPVGPRLGSHNQNIIGNIKNAISSWDNRAGHHSQYCLQVLQYTLDTFLTSETLNSDGWILVTYLLFTSGYKSLLSVGMRPCPPPPPPLRCRCWVIIQCHTFCTGK